MKEDVKHIIWTGTLTKSSAKPYRWEKRGCFLTVLRQRQKKWSGHNATWQFDA